MSKNILVECAYKPGELHIDTIFKDGINQYCSTTKEQYLKDGYLIIPELEALQLMEKEEEKNYFQDVFIINEERYYDMLGILPPLKMFNSCFLMRELNTGNITNAFIKLENQYFEFYVRTNWTYEEIINQVLTLLLKQYKNICDLNDWDYEMHYIEDIKNNDGAISHIVQAINAGSRT